MCARLGRAAPPKPGDVAIPVETVAGHVAQVDFGYAGMMYDTESDKLRRAWVFVMVLGRQTPTRRTPATTRSATRRSAEPRAAAHTCR